MFAHRDTCVEVLVVRRLYTGVLCGVIVGLRRHAECCRGAVSAVAVQRLHTSGGGFDSCSCGSGVPRRLLIQYPSFPSQSSGSVPSSSKSLSASTWTSARGREILCFGVGVTLGLFRVSVYISYMVYVGFKTMSR